MAALESRAASALVIQQVLQGRNLDAALGSVADRLAEKERALTAEISYGVCRWYFQLNALLELLLEKPLKSSQRVIHALMLAGLYQLLHTRIPAHAAVSETVAATGKLGKGWAKSLTNAVLRRFLREQQSLLQQLHANDAATLAMPQWLLLRLQQEWPGQWRRIAESYLQRPPMTLRVNCSKATVEAALADLAAAGFAAHAFAQIDSALMLEKAAAVESLPGFSAGYLSVQDAGAQFAAQLLDTRAGDEVLDACAAPGGKTTHILELQPDARVTAVDVDSGRLQRVEENLQRLGQQARLLTADVSLQQGEWRERSYERILLDVPCSASGVIRRHPDIKLLRKAGDVDSLAARQQQILESVWSLLKSGGVLLYVTCSLLAEENQQQIEAFLARHDDAKEQPIALAAGHKLSAGWQILPGESNMDGFYYALLGKR
ncbi:MAG: 16S rRNA (cytosine(967)-C(5))-methyltransferase RsmB [Pseudomonadota bacterium]|nr:16S rRNA (cytosine(967)-C(5))-methyltransferase RsmB [Pseudomonadota bacterium]